MKNRVVLMAAVPALFFTACAPGPAYRRPMVSVPRQWPGEPARGTSAEGAPVEQWWTTFHDAELESLVSRAAAANLDLQLAAARIQEARANRGLARSNGLPQVNAALSATRDRKIIYGVTPAGLPFETNFLHGQFDMSWEADLFGRISSQVRGASADLAAQEEDRRNVLVTLLGDVATNYTLVRGAQLRLGITERNIGIQHETLDLTRALAAAGQATDRDVAQAEAQLELTRAGIPQLETDRDVAIHRLGVLLGSEPNTLAGELGVPSPLPVIPAEVPVGLPSELLARRPDIRRAENQLAAATARIGEARADFFPRFSLTGTAGRESTQLHLLALGTGNLFSFGPSVSLPVFTAGRIRANVKVQEARAKQVEVAYRVAVLTALEETENALIAYSGEQEHCNRLERAIAADRTALELAREQYRAGLADFLTVLDAERALAGNEDQLAQGRTAVVTRLVSVYKALGGGWSAPPNTP
ncbi:MAG: efflux transporter outer membrane subunit [Acidobacteriia bacterium]|nr:efflux transporter outer membrane subunit [Terriglobia bacterium]